MNKECIFLTYSISSYLAFILLEGRVEILVLKYIILIYKGLQDLVQLWNIKMLQITCFSHKNIVCFIQRYKELKNA